VKPTSASTRALAIAGAASLALLAGCAAVAPREALPQQSSIKSQPMTFAGSYKVKETELTLTVNGEPIMRGTFPPYTPTLNLNGDYKGTPVRAECYFSSTLSQKRGLVGIIAGSVQSANGKTGDTCKMMVQNTQAAILNF
jgi:hypothetical protein